MKKRVACLILLFFLYAFSDEDPQAFMKQVNSRFLLKMAMAPQEKVYVHTDRMHYNAGEKIWFRAYLANGITHVPSLLSKFVYVELADREGQVHQRVKVIRRDSVYAGFLSLSQDLPQDEYMIRAYSYGMQNLGADYFFKKQIRVLNPRKTEEKNLSGVPEKSTDDRPFDVDLRFFPEGGALLSGNYQVVGFKAIAADGLSVALSGYIFDQHADTVAVFATEHLGMGQVKIPVQSGKRYYAVARTVGGFEKRVDLPEVKEDGIGLKVVQRDSLLKYSIVKGEQAVLPDRLYVLVHSRGFLYTIVPVDRFFTGVINARVLLEGIAHIVLLDDQCRIYSERICFVSRKDKPRLRVVSDRPHYSSRDRIGLELRFEENVRKRLNGSFSVSVTDDSRVFQDSTGENILSGLLLTSDLKGYVEKPGTYFEPGNRNAAKYLDVLMLTQGWTKFDIAREIKGEYDSLKYYQEQGQVISGVVENFWGKNVNSAQVLLLSTAGHVLTADTDSSGHFLVEGIAFPDSTKFIIQGSNRKGRRNVAVRIDAEQFLPVTGYFPVRARKAEEEEAFFKKFARNYYYENGEKIYMLEEAVVQRLQRSKSYSFYDELADYRLDSLKISTMKNLSITQVVEQMPGIVVQDHHITRLGRDTLMILINDLPEDFDQFMLLQPEFVKSIGYMDGMKGRVMFGDAGAKGVMIINIDPARRITKLAHPSMQTFTLLGYQKPAGFYMPAYDVAAVRQNHEYDERSTIYWNPAVNVTKDTPVRLAFYAADGVSQYTVVVEGVTSGGEVCREVVKVDMAPPGPSGQ